MNWYTKLYTGEKAKKKKADLICKIENGKTPVNTYLMTLPAGKENQLEIVPAWNLKFWHNKANCPMIVGLGCGKDEMLSMLCQIVQEVLEKTGGVDLRGYFEHSEV